TRRPAAPSSAAWPRIRSAPPRSLAPSRRPSPRRPRTRATCSEPAFAPTLTRMNAHDPEFAGADLAKLHYGDGDFAVLKPGRFVVCAVSGRKIPLEALRYWSATLQ